MSLEAVTPTGEQVFYTSYLVGLLLVGDLRHPEGTGGTRRLVRHALLKRQMGGTVGVAENSSIIALDKFIQATRDSGYRGTVSAVSELVDNAVQASARHISVRIEKFEELEEFPIMLSILDDGHGMSPQTLRQALRFGGSTRFNDRSGLGRYGMGLPNASLSQARRVEVFSWIEADRPYYTYLDVDEIASGEMIAVPVPRRVALPEWMNGSASKKGTLVVWTWCDRLENRRISTLEQKLLLSLGRIFRYFIWDGVEIDVNGEPVIPVDPLYLRQPSLRIGGRIFGEQLRYEVRAPGAGLRRDMTGEVIVTFAELPVDDWHGLPNEEKKQLGITNGAGVSVVRAGREVDYGWFFLAGKRRENYDDWWRAEVRFDPVLDELFGITHTKQEVRPHESLLEILATDMSEIARVLNARVRQSHVAVKTSPKTRTAEEIAQLRDGELREIRVSKSLSEDRFKDRLLLRQLQVESRQAQGGRVYRIIEDDLGDTVFYRPLVEKDRISIVLNPRHRFYKMFYRPLLEADGALPKDAPLLLQLLLISAARAEAATSSTTEAQAIARFREEWSAVLEVLLKL